MKKPGSVTVVVGVLILMLAGGILLVNEKSAPAFKRERGAPVPYAKHGDYVEYEGGVICRVMSPREPYTETCPPNTSEERVFVAVRLAEHVRGTEFETKFFEQFHNTEQQKEEK